MNRAEWVIGRRNPHQPRTLRRLFCWLRTCFSRVHPNPILVLGNQKSGTTAIAALLAECAGLSVTLDLREEIRAPLLPRVRRGEMPFSEFIRRNKLDFSREVVKEPHLSLFLNELRQYFPQSKMVFIIRDPRDNIRSILDRLKLPGSLDNLDEQQWASISPAWRLVVDGRWLGIAGDSYIQQLATRWNHIAGICWKHRDELAMLRYEDFCKDKGGEILRLVQALGLTPLRDISGRLDHQFQPRGNRNITWLEFFGARNLSVIERACEPMMKRFNYPLP
jgi:hypothetical protein